MNKTKTIIIFLILISIGITINYFLYPQIYPYAAIGDTISKEDAEIITDEILREENIQPSEFDKYIKIQLDIEIITYLQLQGTLFNSITKIEEMSPFYYEIDLIKKENGSSKGTLQINKNGKLISLKLNQPNKYRSDLNLMKLVKDTKEYINSNYVYKEIYLDNIKINNFIFKRDAIDWNKIINYNDDIIVTYKHFNRIIKKTVFTEVKYNGCTLKSVKTNYNIKNNLPEKSFWLELPKIISLIGIFFGLLIVGYKKIRDYEISYKAALIWGILVFISAMITLTLSQNMYENIVQMLISSLFIGFAVIVVWAVTEVIVREDIPDKLFSIDLFSTFNIKHSRIGENILIGTSLGIYLFAVSLVIVGVVSLVFDIHFVNILDTTELLAGNNGFLVHLSDTFYNVVFISAIFCVFIPILINKKIKNNALTWVISAIPFAVIIYNTNTNLWVSLIASFLFGIVVIWIFFRYDFLTMFTTIFVFTILPKSLAYIYINSADQFINIAFIGVFFLALIVFSLITFMSKDKINDWRDVSPLLTKHIAERKRLKGEFATAHYIQMSFLPKEFPFMKKVKILSRCIPCQEIGGDYFDFVKYDDNQIGFIIGDVSGKGARAAFFMTLVKGFYKALTENIRDPFNLVVRINKLFIENSVKGNFITLCLGLLDTDQMQLEIVRGGHNPVLIKRKNGDIIEMNPKGPAIGLIKADKFDKNIVSESISLEPGDKIILFTDGITEAMNKFRIEYGYNNLIKTVSEHSDLLETNLLDYIYNSVEEHIAGNEQSDDMTMLIFEIDE